MRKTIQLFTVVSVSILFAMILTSCDTANETANLPAPSPSPYISEQTPEQTEWTIEELGEKIVAAGTFWEEWWSMTGRFNWQHFEQLDWELMPEHFAEIGMSMGILLPSSGFEDINDIRNYLLQYYTEAWVDAELFQDFAVFVEYDGILFINVTRAGFPRPNWETAEHVLIEQDGNHAVVETTFLHGAWHRGYEYAYPTKAVYRFTFIDGKIDAGLGPWAHSENMMFVE